MYSYKCIKLNYLWNIFLYRIFGPKSVHVAYKIGIQITTLLETYIYWVLYYWALAWSPLGNFSFKLLYLLSYIVEAPRLPSANSRAVKCAYTVQEISHPPSSGKHGVINRRRRLGKKTLALSSAYDEIEPAVGLQLRFLFLTLSPLWAFRAWWPFPVESETTSEAGTRATHCRRMATAARPEWKRV